MSDTPFRMTQGMDVLSPKTGHAYPIPCSEWDNLRNKIAALRAEPWLFHTMGSVLLGIGTSTGVAALLGGIKDDPSGKNLVIAWAITVVTIAVGAVCLYFAHKERSVQSERAGDVVTLMDLIEQRFDRSTKAVASAGQSDLNARHGIGQVVSQLASSDQRLKQRGFSQLINLTLDDTEFRITAQFGASMLTTGGALNSIRAPKDYLDVLIRAFDSIEAKRAAGATKKVIP